jgi:hypothetical protein
MSSLLLFDEFRIFVILFSFSIGSSSLLLFDEFRIFVILFNNPTRLNSDLFTVVQIRSFSLSWDLTLILRNSTHGVINEFQR